MSAKLTDIQQDFVRHYMDDNGVVGVRMREVNGKITIFVEIRKDASIERRLSRLSRHRAVWRSGRTGLRLAILLVGPTGFMVEFVGLFGPAKRPPTNDTGRTDG
jgi:hypothetical protein